MTNVLIAFLALSKELQFLMLSATFWIFLSLRWFFNLLIRYSLLFSIGINPPTPEMWAFHSPELSRIMPRSFANFSWRIFDLPIFSSIPEFWPTISLLASLTNTNHKSSNWVATTFTNLLDLGSKEHKSKCISVYLITVSSDIEYNRVQLNTTNSEQYYLSAIYQLCTSLVWTVSSISKIEQQK